MAAKPVGTVKLSTQQIAFGSTRIGDTARTTLGIYSLVVPNKIDSVSISHSAFSIVQTLPALLNAYDSSIVKISFAPKSIGNVSDVLRVYCNSSSQILTLPLSGTGSPMNGVTDEKNSPESFSLEQNYPNPFNPTTEMRYSVGTSSRISLRIYDLLGREVAMLVDGVKDPGNYRVTWNAATVASGMYIYTILASPMDRTSNKIFMMTKKLILLK